MESEPQEHHQLPFIRGVASVSKNTSSKMLLNQSELLFLRANNIIKTSNFTRPPGSLRPRRDFCLLFINVLYLLLF